VNLASLSDIRAGEASREGGQGSGAETGDGGRPGEGSPPEGPGETAVEKEKPVRGIQDVDDKREWMLKRSSGRLELGIMG
jgi:hypothetical protein